LLNRNSCTAAVIEIDQSSICAIVGSGQRLVVDHQRRGWNWCGVCARMFFFFFARCSTPCNQQNKIALENLGVESRVSNGMGYFDVGDAPAPPVTVVGVNSATRDRSLPLASLTAALGCLVNSWFVAAEEACMTTLELRLGWSCDQALPTAAATNQVALVFDERECGGSSSNVAVTTSSDSTVGASSTGASTTVVGQTSSPTTANTVQTSSPSTTTTTTTTKSTTAPTVTPTGAPVRPLVTGKYRTTQKYLFQAGTSLFLLLFFRVRMRLSSYRLHS
jgi:cell division septation protein DedD